MMPVENPRHYSVSIICLSRCLLKSSTPRRSSRKRSKGSSKARSISVRSPNSTPSSRPRRPSTRTTFCTSAVTTRLKANGSYSSSNTSGYQPLGSSGESTCQSSKPSATEAKSSALNAGCPDSERAWSAFGAPTDSGSQPVTSARAAGEAHACTDPINSQSHPR